MSLGAAGDANLAIVTGADVTSHAGATPKAGKGQANASRECVAQLRDRLAADAARTYLTHKRGHWAAPRNISYADPAGDACSQWTEVFVVHGESHAVGVDGIGLAEPRGDGQDAVHAEAH